MDYVRQVRICIGWQSCSRTVGTATCGKEANKSIWRSSAQWLTTQCLRLTWKLLCTRNSWLFTQWDMIHAIFIYYSKQTECGRVIWELRMLTYSSIPLEHDGHCMEFACFFFLFFVQQVSEFQQLAEQKKIYIYIHITLMSLRINRRRWVYQCHKMYSKNFFVHSVSLLSLCDVHSTYSLPLFINYFYRVYMRLYVCVNSFVNKILAFRSS